MNYLNFGSSIVKYEIIKVICNPIECFYFLETNCVKR